MLALLLLLGWPASAVRAEDERALSAGVSYGTFSVPGQAEDNMEPPALSPTVGGALSVVYERMLGTDFGLRAELLGAMFYGGEQKDQSALSYAGLGDAGIVFRFDILKYVPYVFGGVGGVASTGGPIARDVDLVLVVGGGLDYLQGRERSYGLELRLASFGGDVTVFTAGFRATHRWGFF